MYVPYLRLEIILGHYQNYQAEASLQLATFITYYIYIYIKKKEKKIMEVLIAWRLYMRNSAIKTEQLANRKAIKPMNRCN